MLPDSSHIDQWQVIVGLSLLVLFCVRIVSHFRARTWEKGKTVLGGVFLVQLSLTLPALIGVLLFVIYPRALSWSALPLPEWLRYCGLALMAVAIVLLTWIQYTLGANFSPLVRIKSDQKLVVAGPYRWVRHPMYTAIAMLSISIFLMTANWFVGGAWCLCTALVMFIRTPGEERVLLEAFGSQYRSYMATTPRFIPRLRPLAASGANDFPLGPAGAAQSFAQSDVPKEKHR